MAKRQRSGGLNRFAGKRFVFNGSFDYGVKDSLVAMTELQNGKVCDGLDDKVDYLVVPDLSGSKTIQKKAMSLNRKGRPSRSSMLTPAGIWPRQNLFFYFSGEALFSRVRLTSRTQVVDGPEVGA